MADLIIKENELKQLDAILGEIPMKFGMPLVNYINQIAQTRAGEAQKESLVPIDKNTSN